MSYLFTSESVSEGHPDKVADQISDAILDEFLKTDPDSKVACETFVTTGLVVIGGEVKSKAYIDIQKVAREVIRSIGYTKSEYMFDADSCGIISTIHEQSAEINQGVMRERKEDQGAGDQGMMFGYATNETDNYMPLALDLAHRILIELAKIRREQKIMKYLRPDAKAQVTIEYSDDHKPLRIDTIVISAQHDEFDSDEKMQKEIAGDIQRYLLPRMIKNLPRRISKLFGSDIKFYINPTGKFVIGGPHGDTGLTGRKIIVDTYGGKSAHGGGAFSGKDPSKVDRSAAYAARHIAKNLVASGIADQVQVQVAYAIGISKPVGLYVTTFGTAKVKDESGNIMSDSKIAEIVQTIFDMRPYAIVERLKLRNPIYIKTAAYGHMGKEPVKAKISIGKNGKLKEREVELFTWEKLDYIPQVKKAFHIS
ncbi:MAG: methionine adenosyltransferase [Chitinophagales bacterium]|nr:methionine adenosyltransferase [Chitinophagales bacterium]